MSTQQAEFLLIPPTDLEFADFRTYFHFHEDPSEHPICFFCVCRDIVLSEGTELTIDHGQPKLSEFEKYSRQYGCRWAIIGKPKIFWTSDLGEPIQNINHIRSYKLIPAEIANRLASLM